MMKPDFFGRWRRAPFHIQVCLLLSLLLMLVAVGAPWITPYAPDDMDLLNRNAAPTWSGGGHLLGTDQLGRDLLSRCIYGLRVSVGIALLGLVAGCLIGVSLGLISGFAGGWFDRVIMALVDFQLAIPFMLFTLLGITFFGTTIPVLIVLVGLAKWETYARVTRGLVLALRENQFIEASYAIGASLRRIVVRHILPNIASTLVVLLTLNFPLVLMLESSLSFLGIGVQPPTASLGRMVGEGKDYLMTSWWVVLAPAGVILVIATMMQTVGDWLRDVLDVRLKLDKGGLR